MISGDLRLVQNGRLRKLFTKGPKYREKKFVNWNHVEENILRSVKECAKAWSEKHKKSESYLKPWVLLVSEKVKRKIIFLKGKKKAKNVRPVLSSVECQEALATLQEKFVICPIDKASSNIAFVCKRFYAEVLVKELGLDGVEGASRGLCHIRKSTRIFCEYC